MFWANPILAQPRGEIVKEFYLIHELNQNNLTFGTYQVDGYVVKIYSCRSELNELGNPCSQDYIVVSERSKSLGEIQELSEEELIVFVDSANDFKTGGFYHFLIQIMDVKTMPQNLNNIRLIYFSEENLETEEMQKYNSGY